MTLLDKLRKPFDFNFSKHEKHINKFNFKFTWKK